jgi:hypothetical protein
MRKKHDFAISVVYTLKTRFFKIKSTQKKSAAEKRTTKSVSSFSSGRNSSFSTFRSPRRMPPLNFTSSENVVSASGLDAPDPWRSFSQNLDRPFEKRIDSKAKNLDMSSTLKETPETMIFPAAPDFPFPVVADS